MLFYLHDNCRFIPLQCPKGCRMLFVGTFNLTTQCHLDILEEKKKHLLILTRISNFSDPHVKISVMKLENFYIFEAKSQQLFHQIDPSIQRIPNLLLNLK